MHAQTKLLLGSRSLITNTHVQPRSKSTQCKTEQLWWFGGGFFWGGGGSLKNAEGFITFCNFFCAFLKLPHFTLVRKSKASHWLLPEQLSKPVAAGREGAILEAIMLLPAVAWVGWWLLTEDPASQTVAIAPYAIYPSSAKALPAHKAVEECTNACSFLAQQNKPNKPLSLTLQLCTSSERLHFVFCAALKKTKIFKWLTCNYYRPSKTRENYLNLLIHHI